MTPKPAMKKLVNEEVARGLIYSYAASRISSNEILDFITNEVKRNVREFAERVRPHKNFTQIIQVGLVNEEINEALKEYK